MGFFLISDHCITLLSISQQKYRTECLAKLRMQMHVIQWKFIMMSQLNDILPKLCSLLLKLDLRHVHIFVQLFYSSFIIFF